MIKKSINFSRNRLQQNVTYQADSLEIKVARITENKEPITDAAPIIFTERKDGVLPGYDIRTDRWDIALDAMDKIAKSNLAKRDNVGKSAEKSQPDSLQGTDLGKSEISKE